ncbi:general secretion pathway protein GspB [Methylocaldum sp.]|uniref:general secretion pathway protein GspB n=1 Tax=Methylocaldum sp. TaxID=1969727 RepID=UPI002D6A7941|nr:general secretion pathway protein GspB [Methylocaldum sp.]HYE36943.1 general secretion pathway protein GspB [Methylocaldum sp.]
MSYILEALRKSERERQAGQAAPLAPVQVDPAPPRHRGLAWMAALLIVLNGAVLGYLWLTRWGKSEPPAQPIMADTAKKAVETDKVESAAASGATAAQSDSAPATLSSPEIQPPEKEEPPALVQVEQPPVAQRPKEKADDTADQSVALPTMSKPKSAPPEKAERLSAQTTDKRLDKPAEKSGALPRQTKPVDHREPAIEPATGEEAIPPVAFRAPAGAPEPRDPPPQDLADKPAIPFLHAMPVDFQQRMAPITINVFAYSEQPEERFAIIDMKKYRVGDRIQGGAELLEIRSDSLVLQSEGRKFRIPRP